MLPRCVQAHLLVPATNGALWTELHATPAFLTRALGQLSAAVGSRTRWALRGPFVEHVTEVFPLVTARAALSALWGHYSTFAFAAPSVLSNGTPRTRFSSRTLAPTVVPSFSFHEEAGGYHVRPLADSIFRIVDAHTACRWFLGQLRFSRVVDKDSVTVDIEVQTPGTPACPPHTRTARYSPP
ncbi:hypothetical protein FB451DRAFT_1554080 [Mycena latifolia]|nr:hypothetical protein FB451DRAFT_1554080 [Mycena latifolia]